MLFNKKKNNDGNETYINSAWDLYVQLLNDMEVTQHFLLFHADCALLSNKIQEQYVTHGLKLNTQLLNTDPGCKMSGSSTFSLADLVSGAHR